MRGMLLVWGLAFAASPAHSASHPQAVALSARESSGDIVFSERARRGAPLWLVEKPARHAAGVAVPAGVAQLYGNGNGNSAGGNGNGGGNSDDKGNSGPWEDSDDHDQGGGNDKDKTKDPVAEAQELITNHEFSQGLSGWEHKGAYVAKSFGPINADPSSADGTFAVVHNGYWDQSAQGFLQQSIPVPSARKANFAMLYNFVTTEWPSWQGTEFNDHFKMTLSGPSGELELSKAVFLNSGSFAQVLGVPLFGWDYTPELQVIGGQTGWQTYSYSQLPLKSGIYALRIEVNDVGDDIVDSALLLDKVSLK